MTLSISAIVISVVAVLWYLRMAVAWTTKARGCQLPPGPSPLPIVGNVLNMPSFKSWYKFRDLAFKYGVLMLIDDASCMRSILIDSR